MSLKNIHLRKLLKLMFLNDRKRRSELRKDIRNEISKKAGHNDGGQDFYVPFWYDAKEYVFTGKDLNASVQSRIQADVGRSKLYSLLCEGFLLWWTERRRWTNQPFERGQNPTYTLNLSTFDAFIKIDNFLTVRDGDYIERFIYPYFSEDPVFSDDAARLGLWAFTQTCDPTQVAQMRILDVIRGRTFSIDRTPLRGNEEDEFNIRYAALLKERDTLSEEYR